MTIQRGLWIVVVVLTAFCMIWSINEINGVLFPANQFQGCKVYIEEKDESQMDKFMRGIERVLD